MTNKTYRTTVTKKNKDSVCVLFEKDIEIESSGCNNKDKEKAIAVCIDFFESFVLMSSSLLRYRSLPQLRYQVSATLVTN